jgi:hypothetical protein
VFSAEKKGMLPAAGIAVNLASQTKTISQTQKASILETTKLLEQSMDATDIAQEGGVLPETESRDLMIKSLRFLEFGSRLITRGEKLKEEGLALMQQALVGVDVGKFQSILRKWFGGKVAPSTAPLPPEELASDDSEGTGEESDPEAPKETQQETQEDAAAGGEGTPKKTKKGGRSEHMKSLKRKMSGDEQGEEEAPEKKAKVDPKPESFIVVTDPKAAAVMGLPQHLHPTMEKLADGSRSYYCMAEGCEFSCSGGDPCSTHVRKMHTKQKVLCYICGHTNWSCRMMRKHHRDEHPDMPIEAPAGYEIPPVDPPALEGESLELEVKHEAEGAELEEVVKAVGEATGE